MTHTTINTLALASRGAILGTVLMLLGFTQTTQAQTMVASIQPQDSLPVVYASEGIAAPQSYRLNSVETVAFMSHGYLSVTSDPVFVTADENMELKLEIEGRILNAKLMNEKGLRNGMWLQYGFK